MPDLQTVNDPDPEQVVDDSNGIFLDCAVTRAAARRARTDDNEQNDQTSDATANSIENTVTSTSSVTHTLDGQLTESCLLMTREQLIKEQQADVELRRLMEEAVDEEEVTRYANCFYVKSGVLMRKWKSPDAPASDEWRVVHQIVLPHCCRRGVISVAHDPPLGGHIGVNKTYHKVLAHFY